MSDGRYDELHEYNDYEQVGRAIIDMQTKKIVRFVGRDSVIGDGIAEMDMTTRFMTVDPMAEKYFQLSPYAYCANNPILFIDPNGEEVWIYYTDDNGKQQSVQYSRGMSYKGNSFVETTVAYLNKMDETDNGHSVLGSLILAEDNYNFTNTVSKDENGNEIKGSLQFSGIESGGGEIHAATLMDGNYSEDSKLESTAHELFHGYQNLKGTGGKSINNEVEAYLFGSSVAQRYAFSNNSGSSSTSLLGNNSLSGQSFQKSAENLFYHSFNYPDYKNAILNFQAGSIKNATGLYDAKLGYKIKPFNPNPLISKLYPLNKF